jgi:predicted ATP-grasp superfamily ATP-dependent carboligase
MTASPAVGVVGASARAAAHSLARAGLSAWAVDQFNDRDLARVAPCALCPEGGYPHALPELAARFPPGPVLYTGGLENHPHVVEELARTRELWGNPPEVLARVRDPFALAALLSRTGFRVPRLIPLGEACPADGRWLRKPLRSGGGLGIRFARAGEPASPDHVFQEFVEGAPMSALFVSDLEEMPTWPDVTALFGVTEQLIGETWLHAAPFAYCGNIGPVALPESVEARLSIDALVANRTMGARGVWGLDFVISERVVRPLEVNPRYTGAVEVLELASRSAILETHRACFTGTLALAKFKTPRRYDRVVAKAVYYAPHAIRFPHSGPWDADLTAPFDPWRVPGFADVPGAGARIEPGWPVLTFFAEATSSANARQLLQSRAAELDSLFREHQP